MRVSPLPARAPKTRVRSSSPLPVWKRVLDVLCCLAALPALLLVAAVVAVLLKRTSPGPLFFRQERIGYLGRRFLLYKFRTMHVNADAAEHRSHVATLQHSGAPMAKLDVIGDRRLIPGARLLRAAGLDELPQLLNVLRGEMSVVGPRPCIPYEYEQYSERDRARFQAAPGLTGLWQVSGKNRTTFAEMVNLDLAYAQTRSPWLDLVILARTPFAVLRQLADTRRRLPAPARAPAAAQSRVTLQISSVS